jgi:hypothetical protein
MENYETIDAHHVPLADADDIEIIGVLQGVPRIDVVERMDIDAIANNDSDDDLPPIGPLYQANIDDEDEGHLRAFHPSIYVARILSNIDTQDEYTLVSRHDLQDLLPRRSTTLPRDFESIEAVIHEFDARMLVYHTDRIEPPTNSLQTDSNFNFIMDGDIFQATLTAYEPVEVSSENVAEIVERRLRGLVTIRPQITSRVMVSMKVKVPEPPVAIRYLLSEVALIKERLKENDRYLEGELFLEEFKVVLKPSCSYNLRTRSQESSAAFVDSLPADDRRRERRIRELDDARIRDIDRLRHLQDIYIESRKRLEAYERQYLIKSVNRLGATLKHLYNLTLNDRDEVRVNASFHGIDGMRILANLNNMVINLTRAIFKVSTEED